MFNLPPEIKFVISALEAHGFEAYTVGGCVRDMLCEKTPDDFDITTSALPYQIQNIFEHTVPTGIKHGTVTVVLDNYTVEVTTFRSDGGYTDCRRPDSVEFVSSLREDLSRRDFTVNAMAYNNTGLYDFYGGKEDIRNKILRAVGNPERRFKEDALRILRLFRFASTLGFSPEKATLNAALKFQGLLENVSRERIFSEIIKAICGKYPQNLLPLINSGGLSFIGINKFENPELLTRLDNEADIRLYAFLYLCGCDIKAVLSELRVSNRTEKYCILMDKLNKIPFPKSKVEIKNSLYMTSPDIFLDFLCFKAAGGTDMSLQKELSDEIIKNREPYRISDLAINGKDIKALGITGTLTGDTLERLRLHVINRPADNTREKLIGKIKQLNGN